MSYCSFNKNSFLYYIDENKLFSCLTTFTFIVIGIFLYILNKYTFFDKRKIPHAITPSAPFGNVKDVLFQNSSLNIYLWKYYNRFKRKQYKFGGLYLFFKPSVLIVNSTLIEKVVSEEKCLIDVYTNRNVRDYKFLKLFDDKITVKFLLKYNDIKDTLMLGLNEKCISTVIHNFFMETTCLAFGFNSLEIMNETNSLLQEKINSSFLHYFGLVYPTFKRKNSYSELKNLLANIVEYRKKNDIRRVDLIQNYIDLPSDLVNSLDLAELFKIFVDNIIHCYTTILFCLYELASNKEVLQELTGEIRRFNKHEKLINLDNLKELVYLDAVVKETLRKYPPVSTILKKCNEDYKVTDLGLDVPKDCFIFISIFGIQHDPTNFTSPEEFDPDRFVEENLKFIKPNTYNPFGFDLKNNIGFGFTTLHIKLGLLRILSSYTVNVDRNCTLKFDSKKIPLYPEEPLPLYLEPL